MTKSKQFYLIVNELAGSGNGERIYKKVIQILERKKQLYQIHKSQYAGHTVTLTREFAQKFDQQEKDAVFLLIIGGDGTLHEAIYGLGEKYLHIPIAFIPAGSGNDFARGTALSREPEKALEHIMNMTEARKTNIIAFRESTFNTEGYAVNNVGVGFDAAVIKRTNRSSEKVLLNKYNMGSLSYFLSVLAVFFKQKGFPFSIDVDGQKRSYSDGFLVTVNNHPFFGGGIGISPNASVYDDHIDLVILEKSSFIKVVWLFILMLMGGRHLRHKDVHYFKGKTIRLYSDHPEETQADGEELGYIPFDFHLSVTSRYFWI